jgi:ABC-type nickel/cobalt efflux system permease component RcnA
VFGLDDSLSRLAAGHGAAVVILVAFALGLRHASDPDHLVAVSTLVAGKREGAARSAGRLGAAWGAGHATTLLALGLPILLVRAYVPGEVESAAEALIGLVIVALALRLLVRWRRGAFHVHLHRHDGRAHTHVHSHADAPSHAHAHPIRTPLQAYSIGLVHGIAGSGAVAVLLIAAVPNRAVAAVALVVLAVGCALSMTVLSALVGRLFTAQVARHRLAAAIPVLAGTALLFGAWYAGTALSGL